MTAFFVGTATFKDREKFQEYAKQAGPLLRQYGGEPVILGKASKVLSGGDLDHEEIAIAKFPNEEALLAWHNSDEYQALIPLREEASDIKIVTYSKL